MIKLSKTFVEFLVERKKRIYDIFLVVLCILILLAYIIFWWLGYLSFLKLGVGLVFAAFLLFAYLIISARRVEYEYCVAEGEFDVDIIVAKRYRKHLIRSQCQNWLAYGNYSSQQTNQLTYRQKIVVCDSLKSENLYFALFNSPSGEPTLLIFNAVPEIMDSLSPYLGETSSPDRGKTE